MFEVPIIQSGLTRAETFTQIANVFEYLDRITDHVFDKVSERIDQNNLRMAAVMDRIAVTNRKVETLQSTKKAIVMYSPARFPGTTSCEGIPSTFADAGEGPTLERVISLSCQSTPLGESCIKEKLQFFHVRTKQNKDEKLENVNLSLDDNIPQQVSSVSDLYIHNTNSFAFQQRQRTRAAEVPEAKRDIERSPSKLDNKKLDEAPYSILHPNSGMKNPADDFFYTPTMNDAPDLEMPDDLPDLPGIAIDIAFGKTDLKKPARAEAPPIIEEELFPSAAPPTSSCEPLESVSSIPPPPVLPPLPSFSAPPAPPPEPPKTITAEVSTIGGAPTPPPPPPPPPPALPSMPSHVPAATATPKTAPAGDARSNLMEAIRKAGGKAKLRAAAPQPKVGEESDTKRAASSSSSGGNLMDDLHKKLMMRRKGISGTKNPANVLDRLSALIPPPSGDSADGQRGGGGDDDDWK